MFYNIIFSSKTSLSDHIIIGLNDSELKEFLYAYEHGAHEFYHQGTTHLLGIIYKIEIYDISGLNTKIETQQQLKSIINNCTYSYPGTNKQTCIRNYGKDNNLVNTFIKGSFGYNKATSKAPEIESVRVNNTVITPNRFFISHSSIDYEIVNAFVEHILILGLNVSRSNIFCTSIEGTKIKSGEDFKRIIKDELLNANVIIQILSPNYKRSEICLNEMGAAWVLNNNVIPFICPPSNYDIGFIHSNTQQLKLNTKDDLLKFYDDHKVFFVSENLNLANYNKQIDVFLNKIPTPNNEIDSAVTKILSASYGYGNDFVPVDKQIKEWVDKKLNFKISHYKLGIEDPSEGNPKTLNLHCRINGKEETVIFEEGDTFRVR